jgi:hypothetical protein
MVFCSADTNMVIEDYGPTTRNQRNHSIVNCIRNGSVNCIHSGDKGDNLNTGVHPIAADQYSLALSSINQVVIPGSPLQLTLSQMIRGIAGKRRSLLGNMDDECIICLDAFHDRPKMPTSCRCGDNRLNIHRECLYQWRTKSDCCPNCNTPLISEFNL